jgi:GR25 family glycosyltransferase involved in LPS biosynthesis
MSMIRVISLTSTPERRRRFAEAHEGVGFAFFDAVDGHTAAHTAFLHVPYTHGAIGCALSHLALWRQAATTDETLTIAEDDAILRRDFEVASAVAMAQAPRGWDIIVWAWNLDSLLCFNVMPGVAPLVAVSKQEQMRESIPAFREMTRDPVLVPLAACWGTPCYSVSPEGAVKLLNACWPPRDDPVLIPVVNHAFENTGIDIAMMRAYPEIGAYVSLPPLAVTPNISADSLTLPRKGDTVA